MARVCVTNWFIEIIGSYVLFPSFSRCLMAGYLNSSSLQSTCCCQHPVLWFAFSRFMLFEMDLKVIAGLICPPFLPSRFELPLWSGNTCVLQCAVAFSLFFLGTLKQSSLQI